MPDGLLTEPPQKSMGVARAGNPLYVLDNPLRRRAYGQNRVATQLDTVDIESAECRQRSCDLNSLVHRGSKTRARHDLASVGPVRPA
jgi:hypothetical protein